MKLFGANVCPFVHRVRLVLAEKKLEHEYVAIDLANKPSWYHEVLPTGRVPLLEDGSLRLWESDIVCEYLDEAYPTNPLMPQDPAQRAGVRLQANWTSNKFVSTFYRLLSCQESEIQSQHKEAFALAFAELEQALSRTDGPYFFSRISLADTALYPWFERWCVLKHYRDFALPLEGECVKRWYEAMTVRDSVQQLAESEDFFIAQYQSYADGSKLPS